MTFESMGEVLDTIRAYSLEVESLLSEMERRSEDEQVGMSLGMARKREHRLQRGVERFAETMPPGVKGAYFMWHDRRQLFAALENERGDPPKTVDAAVAMIERLDGALLAYYRALRDNTHNGELVDALSKLAELRRTELRGITWAARDV